MNTFESAVSTGNALNETLSYDVMGNILSLNRTGGSYGMTNYTYTKNGVNGNQLQSTSGNITGSYGYDVNGNLLTDSTKGITLSYNHLNLPKAVTGNRNITYIYDATGTKLRKIEGGKNSDYIGGIHYEQSGTLAFIQTEEGRAVPNGSSFNYEYNLSDHLGNVRASIDKTGNVIQEDEYYAFGLDVRRFNSGNNYLYNGKELQEGLNQYDYGARFYDPVLGRWNVVDPLAEKFFPSTPYSYTVNNPILLNDPDGRDWTITVTQGEDGKYNIQISVNAAIVNASGKKIDMNNYIKTQSAEFNRIFSMNRDDFSVTATLNLRSIERVGDVKEDEHLIVIGRESEFKPNVGGNSRLGGLKVNLNAKMINEDGTTVSNSILSHELGHTGGLDHPFAVGNSVKLSKGNSWLGFSKGTSTVSAYNQKQVDLRTNFMSYPQNYIDYSTYNGLLELRNIQANPGTATRGQIAAIMRYYSQGNLNKDDK